MEALNERVRDMENQRRADQDQINQLREQLEQQQQDRILQPRPQDARHNDLRNQDNAMQQINYAMARKQAEKRINSLPNLSANETEIVKSFIRQATHVWNSIDNEDLETS